MTNEENESSAIVNQKPVPSTVIDDIWSTFPNVHLRVLTAENGSVEIQICDCGMSGQCRPQGWARIEKHNRQRLADAIATTPADAEQLVRLREEVVTLRVDRQAVRRLYDLPDEGDFYEQMADHLEYDTVDKVRLQNAVWNLLTETFYDEGLKNNGVAVKFLMRLHLLAHEAGLPEYSKDNPIVAEALNALGDPATNSPESLAAAALRHALGTQEK